MTNNPEQKEQDKPKIIPLQNRPLEYVYDRINLYDSAIEYIVGNVWTAMLTPEGLESFLDEAAGGTGRRLRKSLQSPNEYISPSEHLDMLERLAQVVEQIDEKTLPGLAKRRDTFVNEVTRRFIEKPLIEARLRTLEEKAP